MRSLHASRRPGDYFSLVAEEEAVLTGFELKPTAPLDGGCFTNQRDWCQATTAWRPPEKRRVRRASEGLRGICATDLSRRGVVLLALDHKQFPVRHLYETARRRGIATNRPRGSLAAACSSRRSRTRPWARASRSRPRSVGGGERRHPRGGGGVRLRDRARPARTALPLSPDRWYVSHRSRPAHRARTWRRGCQR